MVQLMKQYVQSRGAWIDSALLNVWGLPATPRISSRGPEGFPADQLRFTVSEFKGAKPFAGLGWRVAEVAPKQGSRVGDRPIQAPREITAIWESAELTDALTPISVPAGVVKPNHSYRVRARMKDVTGRWSHWSEPIEFVAH